MNDHTQSEKREAVEKQRALDLQEGAAPERVGVYDRPERSLPSPTMMALIALILVIIAGVVVYVLVF